MVCASEAIKSSVLHTTNFKTMTTINNDYNTEMLDQELSLQELQVAIGGSKKIEVDGLTLTEAEWKERYEIPEDESLPSMEILESWERERWIMEN